jgi:hypothetical protein
VTNVIRKLKSTGIAFIGVVALGAVLAPAAHAGSFHIGAQPAMILGQIEAEQQHVMGMLKGGTPYNALCSAATLEGTSVGQAISEATITPTYGTGCKLAGTASVVQPNGCKLTITGAEQSANTFLVDIAGCTEGKQIVTKSALCTIHIPQQNGLSHIIASNIGGNEVTLNATLSSITFSQTGAACPDGNGVTSNQASISGNTVIKAYKHNEVQQVTKHGHQYNELVPGEQVSLSST